MDHVQNSGEATPPTPPTTVNLPNPPPTPSPQVQIVDKPENVLIHDPTPLYKYSAEANDPKVRRKRALANNSNKKSCSLYIQTDPLFWEHIYKQVNCCANNHYDISNCILIPLQLNQLL